MKDDWRRPWHTCRPNRGQNSKLLKTTIATRVLFIPTPRSHPVSVIVTKAFNTRVVEAMRPRMQEIVNELLDEVQQAGRMDVIRDLAVPLPVTVLSEILGVPKSDVGLFKGWRMICWPSRESISRRSKFSNVRKRRSWESALSGRTPEGKNGFIRVKIYSASLATAGIRGRQAFGSELLNSCITLLVAGMKPPHP